MRWETRCIADAWSAAAVEIFAQSDMRDSRAELDFWPKNELPTRPETKAILSKTEHRKRTSDRKVRTGHLKDEPSLERDVQESYTDRACPGAKDTGYRRP